MNRRVGLTIEDYDHYVEERNYSDCIEHHCEKGKELYTVSGESGGLFAFGSLEEKKYEEEKHGDLD